MGSEMCIRDRFSSENWNRSEEEVNALMDLLIQALETQTKKLNEHGVRLQLIGDLSKFSDRIQALAKTAQAETKKNNKLVFNVAINYGGRWDITQACQKISEKVAAGELAPQEITEELISEHISTSGIPCLLYTSPSPRDLSTSRMPSSA